MLQCSCSRTVVVDDEFKSGMQAIVTRIRVTQSPFAARALWSRLEILLLINLGSESLSKI